MANKFWTSLHARERHVRTTAVMVCCAAVWRDAESTLGPAAVSASTIPSTDAVDVSNQKSQSNTLLVCTGPWQKHRAESRGMHHVMFKACPKSARTASHSISFWVGITLTIGNNISMHMYQELQHEVVMPERHAKFARSFWHDASAATASPCLRKNRPGFFCVSARPPSYKCSCVSANLFVGNPPQ